MPTFKLRRLLITTTLGLLASAGGAAEFPTKPITLVVPFAPGGPTDAMARTLATALRPVIGQNVVVENKAGAGGNLGAEAVARAEPDGHTLLFGTSGPLAINVQLFRKINYDPIRSFAPVIQIGRLPNVLAVHPSVPARNLKELVAHAKAKAGTLSYASSGNGASSHLAGVMFNQRAGTDVQHIPYKGTGPALVDLIGGQVTMVFTDVLTALPHAKAGKIRVLGVTTATRSRAFPDVPTLSEQGMTDFDASVFFGIVVPAGTPQDVVTRLNAAFVKVLAQPDVRQGLEMQGLEIERDLTPAGLAVFMRREQAKWKDVIAAAAVKVD
jgi:tripartite-type tricarboxylate transporter receptor subunit TctC